jgi:hypothetical protein
VFKNQVTLQEGVAVFEQYWPILFKNPYTFSEGGPAFEHIGLNLFKIQCTFSQGGRVIEQGNQAALMKSRSKLETEER